MDIKSVSISETVRPGYDVRGSQQLGLVDPSQLAATLMIVEKGLTKTVLSDPPANDRLRLRRSKFRNLGFELFQRERRKANAETLTAAHAGAE